MAVKSPDTFGNLARSGYDRRTRDVMENPEDQGFSTLTLSDAFRNTAEARNESFYYEPQAQSSYESVFIDPEPDRTVLDDLDEGTGIDRTPDIQNTASLLLDPTKPAPHARETHETAIACKLDTHEKLAQTEQDWKDHQDRAAEHLKQAAVNLGHEPGDVLQQFIPQDTASKATAAAGLGSMALPGAGPAGGALDIASELKNSELSRDEKIALIKETTRLAREAAPKDTRISAVGGSKPSEPTEVDNNLAKLTDAKMEQLLTERVEDQPEYALLAQKDHELTEVLDNHTQFAEEYGKTNIGVKAVAHALQGDQEMQHIVAEATYAVDSVPAVDAAHAQLCGDSVAGTGVTGPSVAEAVGKCDFNAVQTVVRINNNPHAYNAAQNALDNYANNAMRNTL